MRFSAKCNNLSQYLHYGMLSSRLGASPWLNAKNLLINGKRLAQMSWRKSNRP